MTDKYEVEVKSLLGSQEKALILKEHLIAKGALSTSSSKQLNHYFKIGSKEKFKERLLPLISESDRATFERTLEGQNLSLRSRETDGRVLIVIKSSIGRDSSANGVSRMEFEREVNTSLQELDRLIEESGAELEAKWSREREEYKLGGTNVCLDKNAGYGWLAEFEQVVDEPSEVELARKSILETMNNFGLEELPQERLERMFAHYNKNWKDYYGTEKVFNIE